MHMRDDVCSLWGSNEDIQNRLKPNEQAESRCKTWSSVLECCLCRLCSGCRLCWAEVKCCIAGLSQEDYFERLEEESQPSVLRTRAQCKQARKKLEKEQRRAARRDAGELPRLPDQIGPLMAQGGTYGQFEQHTRGIGSKLLAQMGFAGKGTGLGRDSQGMAEPLRAVARPKQLGLGA